MTEIQADVKEAARAALSAALRDPRVGFAIKACMIGGAYDAFTAAIEQAITDERERCAEIAEQRFTKESIAKNTKGEPYITGSAAIYAAERIAAAIRGS